MIEGDKEKHSVEEFYKILLIFYYILSHCFEVANSIRMSICISPCLFGDSCGYVVREINVLGWTLGKPPGLAQ